VESNKAYGGAYAAMNSRELGADMIFAWPSSEIAVMGAEGAVRILYRKDIEAADDKDLVMKKEWKNSEINLSTLTMLPPGNRSTL